MDSKIVWDKNDPSQGYKHVDACGSKTLIYKRERAIEEFICAIVEQLVQHPLALQNIVKDTKHPDDGWTKTSRRIGVFRLGMAEPTFSFNTIFELMEKIAMPIINNLKPDLLKLDEKCNFTFLLQLGLKRNWKQECAICLGDRVGHACACGHTQTIILRPCGHAFCDHCVEKSFTPTCPICRLEWTAFFLAENICIPDKLVARIATLSKTLVVESFLL